MALRASVVISTPLKPLANKMRAITRRAAEFWAATAFVSRSAVEDIIGTAKASKVKVRLLTGTYGNQTRRDTFKRLLRLVQTEEGMDVRVWSCGRHRDFHGKLYLWRKPDGRGVAWAGSANFTNGGLQEQGEVLLELRAPWDGPVLRVARQAFQDEWDRGDAISQEFVSAYREAKRVAPDLTSRRRRRRRRTALVLAGRRFVVVTIQHHFPEESRVVQRAGELLGTASDWYRGGRKADRTMRRGDQIFLVDVPGRCLTVAEVDDVQRDGRFVFVAYEPLLSTSDGFVPWNRRATQVVRAAGLILHERRAPRSRAVPPVLGDRVYHALRRLTRRRRR